MKGRLLALLLLSAACIPGARGTSSEPPGPDPKTTVKVENQNYATVTVYVLGVSGERVRLGQVNGLSTQVFTIPVDIVRFSPQVRFELRPIGGRAGPRSETITIVPGDQVELVVPPS